MNKTWKKGTLVAGLALTGFLVMQGSTAMAGDVTMNIDAAITTSIVETVTTDLDLGSIDLDPAGDTITIDAGGVAASGDGGAAALPVATGASVITGGTSGLITVTSAAGVNFDIDVVYPGDGTVNVTSDATGATTVTLDSIEGNSGGGATNGTVNHTGGAPTEIHVGGQVVFPSDAEAGTYSGSMTITLNYS